MPHPTQLLDPAKLTAVTLDVPAAIAHLQGDRLLRPLVEALPPPEITPQPEPFRSLARAIVFQQLSGRVAESIYSKFAALVLPVPETPLEPRHILPHTPETLRTAGLSQAKALALLDLAAHCHDGRVDFPALATLTEDQIRAALLPVRGLGPWTVDMFLLFSLARPDIWPTGDLAIRNALQKLVRSPDPLSKAHLETIAAPWRPYRSAAAWYLWRSLETELP